MAQEESNRVVTEIRAGRQVDISNSIKNIIKNVNYTKIVAKEVDIVRLTEAISTHGTVLLHDAEDLKQELAHLASKKDKLSYSTSFSEAYWTAIEEANFANNIGISTAETNSKARI